MPVVLN